MTIGWALLGPGRHAERNVVAQMVKAAGTKPVAVMSRDRARGEAFAEKFGFARIHTALADVLADPEIDALYDATPDGFHADNAVAAAAAGKHMLIEKPLAISLPECQRAIDACRQHGVQLGVVYQKRHEEAHQEARRLIQAGAIGEVRLARAQCTLRPLPQSAPPKGGNWRADPVMRYGGSLASLGDHAFDTLTYIVGQQIEQITAFTNATQDDPPNERVAAMLMKLSGGAIGHAISSGGTPYARRPVEIHGDAGTIIIANTYADLSGVDEDDPRPRLELINTDGRDVRHFEPSESFRREVEQFSRAVEGDGAPMTSGEEGMQAIAISLACYEAIRTGRTATIEPVATGS